MGRKGILQFMKNCKNNPSVNRDISSRENTINAISVLFSDLHKHYGFLDIEKQSNHQRRFSLLYLEDNDFTFQSMADTTFVAHETFKEYVKFYNRTAFDYLKSKSGENSEYDFILSRYLESGL